MEKRTSAIICFVGFLVCYGLLLTAFVAPHWVNTNILHAGIWQSCTKATKVCMNSAQAMDLVGKGGVARATQAMMCLSLILGFAAGVANMIWIIKPYTTKLAGATCAFIIFAGLFLGIAVAIFSMQYSQGSNALALLTGAGASNLPSGWTYYVAIAATTALEVVGMLACCCACQDDGRVGQDHGYDGPGQRHGRAPGGRGYSHRRGVPSHHDRGSLSGGPNGKAWHTGHGAGMDDDYYPAPNNLYYGPQGGYGYGRPPPPVEPRGPFAPMESNGPYPPAYGPPAPPPSYRP